MNSEEADSSLMSKEICSVIREVLGSPTSFVNLHEPYFPETAWDMVKSCLDSNWVSSAGAYVSQFEKMLVSYTGAKHAIAVSSGTAALQICLHLLGVTQGDEVLTPSLTFVATPNAVSHCGAIPHFVDVEPERLGVDPEALASYLAGIVKPTGSRGVNRLTGRPITAAIVMHCFGHPARAAEIKAVLDHYQIPLVEDAAESLGSWFGLRENALHTGRVGRVSAISFNGNKIMTTGGGGAILTDDADLASRARHVTTTAKVPHAWEFYHDQVAWNYRMPNINAALGVAQLEVLPSLLLAKRRLAEEYSRAINPISGVRMLSEPLGDCSNHWLNALVLDEANPPLRDAVLSELNGENLQSRPIWRPMHFLPHLQSCPRSPLTVTEDIINRIVNIPSSACLAPGWPESFLMAADSEV